ncbi:FAD-dependent oxidoreductase [Nonomuraea thailandensis]
MIDSDAILHLDKVPETLVVVGAGVIGIEYASMFAALGTKVTVVERRERMLEFCDLEIVEALKYHLRDLAVTFRFGENVAAVERRPRGALTLLESGKKIPADCVMYSAGRQGKTAELNLGAAGLAADDRGRIRVDENYATEVPHIYAVGDVIGFPRWRPPRWSRGGWPRSTPAGSRPATCTTCRRSASTPSPRSASSGGRRTS